MIFLASRHLFATSATFSRVETFSMNQFSPKLSDNFFIFSVHQLTTKLISLSSAECRNPQFSTVDDWRRAKISSTGDETNFLTQFYTYTSIAYLQVRYTRIHVSVGNFLLIKPYFRINTRLSTYNYIKHRTRKTRISP